MSFVPTFKLFAANGSTLIYTFPYVINMIPYLPFDGSRFVELESFRGIGSQIIDGGKKPFDLTLEFVLQGTDYSDLTSKIYTLQSTITKFTKYVLSMDKSISTTDTYKVKRVDEITWRNLSEDKKRIDIQIVSCKFKANCW